MTAVLLIILAAVAVLIVIIMFAAYWYLADDGDGDDIWASFEDGTEGRVDLPSMADGSWHAAGVIPPRIAAILDMSAPDETAADYDHSTFPAWLAAVTGRDVEWLLAGVTSCP